VTRISSLLRGWCGYFNQGPVVATYAIVRRYTERRVRRWLMRRTGQRGAGFGQIPNKYLYETLGLYSVPIRRADLSRAKAWRDGRKPDAGNLHVRFAEREQETELCQAGLSGRSESAAKTHRKTKATATVLDSTDLDAAVVHVTQQRIPARQRVARGPRRIGFSR
jgi:hypothetical protein